VGEVRASSPVGAFRTAIEIATAVSKGDLSAREVIEEHLASIAAADGEIHAFNEVTSRAALDDADRVDRLVAAGEDPGLLAGVPVALKDNLCTRGAPTTCSSRILAGWRPPYDATVVRRVREAGGIIIGKTNMDEFAMGSSTESSAFGPTLNPLDRSRVPGGSSGGSAAAVAAGFAPLALGSDTGGSIRQPAAMCGVVGMKPTYGMVSRYGLVAFASSFDQVGPFARGVRDAAMLFEAIAGHDEADSTSLDRPAPAVTTLLGGGGNGFRVGVVSELVDAASADVARRVREAADLLASCGSSVEEVSIPMCVYSLTAYYLLAPAEASSNLARYDGVRYGLRVDAPTAEQMTTATRSEGFGDEVKRRIMLGTYALSAGYYDAYYARAQRVRTLILEAFNAAYERFDVLLAPTTPTTAFALGSKTNDPLAMYLSDVCTIPSNLAGHPAMSVPFGVGDDGMPVGVQVLAPALAEPVMFQVAAVLEDGSPPVGHGAVAAERSPAHGGTAEGTSG
jgi:aspartyl-tRNA(Asn)/glutamyl-tRNA(Gln) amidotransferase subunit A